MRFSVESYLHEPVLFGVSAGECPETRGTQELQLEQEAESWDAERLNEVSDTVCRIIYYADCSRF